jgi:transketolase
MSQVKGSKITDISHLESIARNVREKIVRMLHQAGSGHTGGSLSAVDVAVAIYFSKMRFDSQNHLWKERDRFILSKGHAAPLQYAIMAEAGYFPSETLNDLRTTESPLQGHPCCKRLPGIEVSTGSLGQGLSVANGIALGLRLDKNPARVFCIMGDGEIQEGQIWEAAMTAAHYSLDNLCAVVDNNGLQIDGPVEEVMSISPIHDKWKAFGWHVIEVDGHRMNDILQALDEAEGIKGKPSIIIAHTVKGKGVSLFENKVEYHGVAPTAEELEKALEELSSG